MRINRASDDAAGLSIASTLNAGARTFTVALRNVSDGVSSLQIASSAVDALTNITTRIQELAEQAATGTFSNVQRESLENEVQQLVREYNRTIVSTEFNGVRLLDGTNTATSLQVGTTGGDIFEISIGAAAPTPEAASSCRATAKRSRAWFPKCETLQETE